jgi:hypothetical protein
MTNREDLEQLENHLQEAIETIWQVAQERKTNALALLAILRILENLHREIRDSLFQESLPENRQSLYKLLKDIETKGGWPYIYRMKLSSFLAKLDPDAVNELQSDLSSLSRPSQANQHNIDH